MLDWPFPESLDNGYEELEGSAERDFGSTTMLSRSLSTTTSTLAAQAQQPAPLMPSERSSMSSSTNDPGSGACATTATSSSVPNNDITNAQHTPSLAPSSASPPTKEFNMPMSRSIAKASSSASGTVTDLPSMSSLSSSAASSPATRPGAFRFRRPAAATSTASAATAGLDKSPAINLDDRSSCWWYTKGSTTIASDFILISEFSEVEGPRAVMTIPDNVIDLTFDSFAAAKQRDGGAGARPLSNNNDDGGGGGDSAGSGLASKDVRKPFDVHEFVLRITSVDHQSREMSESFHIPEDIEVYICESEHQYWAYVHHFTLFDVNARGFVRPFNISYITRDPNKILPNYEDIRRKFSKAAQYFKTGNYALFRHELTRKLKDLHYTNNLLSETTDANDVVAAEGPSSPKSMVAVDEEQVDNKQRTSTAGQEPSVSTTITNSASSDTSSSTSSGVSSNGNDLLKDDDNSHKTSDKNRSEAGSSAVAIEATKAELASIKDSIEQATQIISMLEHYSIDGQPLLGHPDESGENVNMTVAAAGGVGAPTPLSEVSPMNSSENLTSIALGRPAGALNDPSLFLGAHGRSGLRIRRKGSTHNVTRILEGGSATGGTGQSGAASAAGGSFGGAGTSTGGVGTSATLLDTGTNSTTTLPVSSPLLTGLVVQEHQSRKNSIVSEFESTMLLHESEYEPQYVTTLYPLARDEVVFRQLRELCVTPMFWNSSLHFHLGVKKLKDILKDYHDDALLLKQMVEDLRRMHPTKSSLTLGSRFQINLRNPDFFTGSTSARPSSPMSSSSHHYRHPLNHMEEPSTNVPLVELLHGISTMANNGFSDDGESILSLARSHQRGHQSQQHLQPGPTSSTPVTPITPLTQLGTITTTVQFDADDADDEETGYDSLDDTSSFFTAITGPPAHSVDTPVRDSFTVTSMDRSARVVEWRQEQHSLQHKRSTRTLASDHAPGCLDLPSPQHHPPPTAFEAGVNLRDIQPFALHHSHSTQRLSDGTFGSAGPGTWRSQRFSGQSGVSGVGVMVPGGASYAVGGGAAGYVGSGSLNRISLSESLIIKTLKEEAATAKHLLFALWSGRRVCITGGLEHETRIRLYVAVLSVFAPHVGFPTREEQLLEHHRQVVPWYQGYDLLRLSDFFNSSPTMATAAATSSASAPSSSPPPPLLPPLLLVGVDRARMDPAILECKEVFTLHMGSDGMAEMTHPQEYADGLVLETIFRSLHQDLFTDDGSFLAFVDSTVFDLLLKAFLYYHFVLCHGIFQHPHLLQHVQGNNVGGGAYGYQPFYSSACSDDGETFSYHRQYSRPSRQQSSSSTKLAAVMSGAGGDSRHHHTLPSSTSPAMGPRADYSKKRGASNKIGGRGGDGDQVAAISPQHFSSRESSDTERGHHHHPRHNISDNYKTGGERRDSHSPLPVEWTRRLSRRMPKGKDRHRHQHHHHRQVTTSGGAGFVDNSADEGVEDEHDASTNGRGGGDDAVNPMHYTTMQGMRKWKKWFDYWSAKSAAMIDPALAVFGKPDISQTRNSSRDRGRSSPSSRPGSRRSSPSGGNRRTKTTMAQVSNSSAGGSGMHATPSSSQHHISPKSRENRERHEREKERDRKRDRERDHKAMRAHFDMRHFSEGSSSSNISVENAGDDEERDGDDESVGSDKEEEEQILSGDERTTTSGGHHPSSRPSCQQQQQQQGSSPLIDTDKELPSLPPKEKRQNAIDKGGQGKADEDIGLGISSLTHGHNSSHQKSNRHSHHLPSLKRVHSSSRKLQPKVPLTLQPTKKGGSSGGKGASDGNHTKSSTTPTTSTLTSPLGSSTFRGLTGALRAMSFGSAFGSPTTTTSTTAVTATVASGSTTSLSAVPTTSHTLLSPTTASMSGDQSHELSDKAGNNEHDVVMRRGSKRAKAKAWLDAKRKKHWHRHGSKDCSAPHTCDEEEEGGEGWEEEGARHSDDVSDHDGDDHDHSHPPPHDEKSMNQQPSASTGAESARTTAKPGLPTRYLSDSTITGAESLSTIAEDHTSMARGSRDAGRTSTAATTDLIDMLTIEEIAQLEPTRSTTTKATRGYSGPGDGNRDDTASKAVAGDVSGRESATEYETSMETWATHADRQQQLEDDAPGGIDEDNARPTRTAMEDGQDHSQPSVPQHPKESVNELTDEIVAVVKELVGGISGEDDWTIVVHFAKLVYAYEKNKEATASPSFDK